MIKSEEDIPNVIAELQGNLLEHAGNGHEFLMFRDFLITTRNLDLLLQQRVAETESLCSIVSFHQFEPFVGFWKGGGHFFKLGACVRRIWFCPVQNSTWPCGPNPEKTRSDVQPITSSNISIKCKADVTMLISLLLHNWKMRAVKEEPFFYYQDVDFESLTDWFFFCEQVQSVHALYLCLSFAPSSSQNFQKLRIYVYPWQYVHDVVEYQV